MHKRSVYTGQKKKSITLQVNYLLAYSYGPKNSQQKHSQVKTRSHCIVSIPYIHTHLLINGKSFFSSLLGVGGGGGTSCYNA